MNVLLEQYTPLILLHAANLFPGFLVLLYSIIIVLVLCAVHVLMRRLFAFILAELHAISFSSVTPTSSPSFRLWCSEDKERCHLFFISKRHTEYAHVIMPPKKKP